MSTNYNQVKTLQNDKVTYNTGYQYIIVIAILNEPPKDFNKTKLINSFQVLSMKNNGAI